MKKVIFGLLAIGLTTQVYSQIVMTEKLSEVTVYATNYKYLNSVNSEEVVSVPVDLLERKVAAFDVKNTDLYYDDYDTYNVTFYIPEGNILAAYDKDGKLIRTAERFKDVTLPKAVRDAVYDRFPEWTITKDIYLVHYHDTKGVSKKYKLKLENGEEVVRVKMDEMGNFL